MADKATPRNTETVSQLYPTSVDKKAAKQLFQWDTDDHLDRTKDGESINMGINYKYWGTVPIDQFVLQTTLMFLNTLHIFIYSYMYK